MRWRNLLLIGGGLAVIGVAIAAVVQQLVSDDDQSIGIGLLAAGVALLVLAAMLGFVAGWFGRERDEIVIVMIGMGLAAAAFLAIGSFVIDDWSIGAALLGVAVAFMATVIGRMTWWIGDAICELRGLPTPSFLVPPAFPKEHPGGTAWTTEAGPALRATLDAVADQVAPRARVEARAIGILAQLPREQPMAVVLTGGRLALQRVDLEGAPRGEPIVLTADQLAEVSWPSEAADGTPRKHINAYDDVIRICTVDGRRLRLRLAYGSRGAGTTTGGPEEIRAWLRTNALAYR